jgi:hypothetical protein
MKILGLTAYARTGKDSLANILIHEYPMLDIRRFAFADNLKTHLAEFVKLRFGYDVFNLTDEQKKIVRPLLIAYGCAQRAIDKDYWVKQVDEQIVGYGGNVVIPDFRFPSEAEYFIKKYGDSFALIELEREGIPVPPDEELYNQPLMRSYVSKTFNIKTSSSCITNQYLFVVRDICDNFLTK